jgi:ubiquinone biosynthesis accessory factor UbiJ
MIKKYSLLALQKAINHALALDENTPTKIAALHGKIIEIIIAPLDVNFYIAFKEQQLQLLDSCAEKPDAIIRSNPIGLIRLSLLPASKVRSLFNDKIHLSGDIELGQSIKALFDELDIDWEGHLAHFTGDVVAYQIGSLFRQGVAFQQHLGTAIQHNLTEYLQEEQRLFPPREEVEDFFNDVYQLSLDVERLQAQIGLLVASHEIN